MEKAHEDVSNVLLQVLDDGHLTDGHGRTVDFKNTLVVMTSNLGSSELLSMAENGADANSIREAVLVILKQSMRPELINRIDDTVVFEQLSREQLRHIIEIQLQQLNARLGQRGLTLEVEKSALKALCDEGYDPQFGARPLKRVIQHRIENPIATGILQGDYELNDTIYVKFNGKELNFEKRK